MSIWKVVKINLQVKTIVKLVIRLLNIILNVNLTIEINDVTKQYDLSQFTETFLTRKTVVKLK